VILSSGYDEAQVLAGVTDKCGSALRRNILLAFYMGDGIYSFLMAKKNN
jgi:hypothetical protein